MDPERLKRLLEAVQRGELDVEPALTELKALPFRDLGYARVDHHRALRHGVPEVILGEPKTPEQIVGIAKELMAAEQNVLVTRLFADKALAVLELCPELKYSADARCASYEHTPIQPKTGLLVPVVSAGTSDLPVAEEAIETLRMTGICAQRVYDAGVAGIHRLVGHLDVLMAAPAVIVVAGMEGALASVVGGMVSAPVIAVPTSVGYGAAFGGLTALCGMLTSCASGVSVVNIDNGFGAAMAVTRILSSRAGA